MQELRARYTSGRKSNYYFQFDKPGNPRQVYAVLCGARVAVGDSSVAERRRGQVLSNRKNCICTNKLNAQ